LLLPARSRDDGSVGKRAGAVLSIFAALVAGAVVALTGSGDDPTVAPSPGPPGTSSLFVEPEGTDARACGDYIATWLDLLHAEDAFPIDELKADLGQGPLWVAVTDAWSEALDLEARMPQEEAARRVVPTIALACEDPDVRAQFLQLQSI
jgi:hypothetical protein